MTGPEVTAAVRRAAEANYLTRAGFRDDAREMYRASGPEILQSWADATRPILSAALDVPQMAATIVDHLGTDTLEGDSETLVCGGCGHVLVTGDPDDDRDPQAEHATHHAALIRAALIGEDS